MLWFVTKEASHLFIITNFCDLTTIWLQEICFNIAVELPLSYLNGDNINPVSAISSDEARADFRPTEFWGRRQPVARVHFFDIRVFTPMHQALYLRLAFPKSELEKKQEYGDRVRSVVHLLLFFWSRQLYSIVDLLSKTHSTP